MCIRDRYEYDAIKAAAIKHAAKSKFFPDLADLTAQCETRAVSSRLARDILELERFMKQRQDGRQA